MGLSLVSVNIEWDRHLDTVLPFLRQTQADVVCIQELLERDIPLFEEGCGPLVIYSPMAYLDRGTLFPFGCGIFSRYPAKNAGERYYVSSREAIGILDEKGDSGAHAVAYADIAKEGASYRIATTHFTWTKGGESTPGQLEDLGTLMRELDALGEFALCGDMNAPRGRETFAALAARYQDNIPASYATSIDAELHKTRDNPTERARVATYMVDGLFTTPEYIASDVSLQFGVSDHAAVVATIGKAA